MCNVRNLFINEKIFSLMYAAKVKYNRFCCKFKGINLCFYGKKTNLIILANSDFLKNII